MAAGVFHWRGLGALSRTLPRSAAFCFDTAETHVHYLPRNERNSATKNEETRLLRCLCHRRARSSPWVLRQGVKKQPA
ncbi:alpha-E domain-containing protein [Tateyamaria sp.]|uniref:alpha-E domain-containing protein n=1 Tax=Tateyamaria sp. TaxID=1929288 RepID=UPI0039B8666D